MTKWIIYAILFVSLVSCMEKNKTPEAETKKDEQEQKTDKLLPLNYDVKSLKWNGDDSHFRKESEAQGERVTERVVYVDAPSKAYYYDEDELIERIEELEDEVEELHQKLDDIQFWVFNAKSSLEDGVVFHVQGSFDDVEDYLNKIEWECDY